MRKGCISGRGFNCDLRCLEFILAALLCNLRQNILDGTRKVTYLLKFQLRQIPRVIHRFFLTAIVLLNTEMPTFFPYRLAKMPQVTCAHAVDVHRCLAMRGGAGDT